MATDEFGDKTELPTDRRRSQAREQGNVARSTDLTAALLMLTLTGAMQYFGPAFCEAMAKVMHSALSATPLVRIDSTTTVATAWTWVTLLAVAVLPMMLLLMVGGLVSNLMQIGFLWSPEVLMPKFERLSPWGGVQRIFSWSAVAKLGGSLGKLTVLASVAYVYLHWRLPSFLQLTNWELPAILAHFGRSLVELSFYLSLSLLSVAVFDYGFQFWKHEQDLRMTKQEIREELKEMDGDPQTRMRRREVHRKIADGKQLLDVPKADVVITNPTEIAVAIQYDPAKMPAPIVVAKGMGEIAASIRRIAAEHGVPIIERKPLARALYRQVKVGGVIPAEMYEVFVEILAYVYRLTGRKPPLT